MSRPARCAVLLAVLVAGCARPTVSSTTTHVVVRPSVKLTEPAEYRAHLGAGRQALDAREYARAVTCLEDAIKAYPAGRDAHLYLGHARAARGANEAALEAFTEALRLDPKCGDAALRRAALSETLGRTDDADRDYQLVTDLDLSAAELAEAYWARGGIADRRGNRSNYRYFREQAMFLDPAYQTRTVAGDVSVANTTEDSLTVAVERLVEADGTEPVLPKGLQFVIPPGATAYLVVDGKTLVARSVQLAIKKGNGRLSAAWNYRSSMSLKVQVTEDDFPRR